LNLMTLHSDPPQTDRRGFVRGLLWASVTALAAAVAYPVLRFISPPRIPESAHARVLAGTVTEIQEKKWKIFPFGQAPGILIEAEPGDYRAFTATCTHLDCTVQFDEKTQRIWCPCHNGWYDLEGRNVEGPPPKPLDPYTVHVEDDEIFVGKA
jgi:Rieske Fe-S protein